MAIQLDRQTETQLEVSLETTTHIENAILEIAQKLVALKDSFNTTNKDRTIKQDAVITVIENSLNDLYSKLEQIGNLNAEDLAALQNKLKLAHDIVSNGISGVTKAVDAMLQEINNSKKINIVKAEMRNKNGVLSVPIPCYAEDVFSLSIGTPNKPFNATIEYTIGVNEFGNSVVNFKTFDVAHFVSAKIPFNCEINSFDIDIVIFKDRKSLLSFEIEKPTEDTSDDIETATIETVGSVSEG